MCDVCKKEDFEVTRIYGICVKHVTLCQEHSRQLFLMGERNFFTIYYYQLVTKYKKIKDMFQPKIEGVRVPIELDLGQKK